MNKPLVSIAAAALAAGASAQSVSFNNDEVGNTPRGWSCGVTGKVTPLAAGGVAESAFGRA